MGVWRWIGEAASSGAGAVGALLEKAGGLLGVPDPSTRRQVAFSIALIALAAKMAKADGVVTSSEVVAFRSVFRVPPSQQQNVTRLFDLARQDVAGFETYATRVAALYANEREMLVDVLDGLFAIARADGAVHERELVYLERVAAIFAITGASFDQIAARHVIGPAGDPYAILGAGRDWPTDAIRAQYLKLVAENHPDRFIARGVPPDFIAIANDRLAAINGAWENVERERCAR